MLFFTIVVIIDISIGYAGDYMQANAKGGGAQRFNNLVSNTEHDILILGSSRAHHHYDTPYISERLGLDVYNAGYDGNGVILSYGVLSLVLQRYTPKLIILDVEPSFDINVYVNDKGHKRYISYLKPYYRNDSIAAIIKDISTEEWIKVHSGLLRYNSNLISLLKDNINGLHDSQRGYEPFYGEYTGPMLCGSESTKLDFVKLKYLRKLIAIAKEKKIPIVLVASPKYAVLKNNIYAPVIDICKQEDVLFWDYQSDTLFMNHPNWFKEPMHLNEKGARMFSDIIFNRIKESF